MSTPAPDAVLRLIDHFDQNRDAYLSGSYNEAQLRREFIGPFFEVLSDLYPPKSPYEFSVIANSVHNSSWSIVPGTDGRKPGTKNREPGTDEVIRLTAGHQAKVEEKPEGRKAGGVFYTPQYIVNCIVKNTVGTLLEGRILRSSDSLTRAATVSPTESGLGMAVTWRADRHDVARIGGAQ